MKYTVEMHDYPNDERVVLEIEATNVFDAIDKAADMVENPDETYLVKAEPIL